ncbi:MULTISPECIES: hypothetical protein [Streptomyces]|jgi:hypothetical protein|uniref:Uncharacterized protein n=1 Tax=Streptomyces thermoviolaceus subsp. thermoviolaceus TaxID=66860 RepID=A0ABX0YS50_STRTL|nr:MULTISPECIES: hypothetical protein [Streptomyces]MCM3264293.1 hypothetical protein [Streptomyces thermoviolaceus]NJP13820.1 hypothetical protein [Streptomyces thermoviolaceus subsp. thermoviolaceus]WTD49441.1 hypothetical protein OG899_19180 [Streptomyces thermoviolaceus]GGV61196.1 hypothetical protein GCM10010499_02370 [Streptomyces thermoviolaceus subsp. apingens]GHA80195.1 hypothetical protein GCM10010512_09250 [Streptomyces thermoviolaceus subsp. thermoviolaceus]
MSDASTSQTPLPAEAQDAPGRGKHRGPRSSRDGNTPPSGRHRKPVQETETAAA